MARRYSSFLIRYWRLAGDKQRIEIEHIQSGDRMRAPSLAAAMAWIERQPVEPAGDSQQAAATVEPEPWDAEHADAENAYVSG